MKIGGKDVEQIIVTTATGEVLAVISDTEIIEHYDTKVFVDLKEEQQLKQMQEYGRANALLGEKVYIANSGGFVREDRVVSFEVYYDQTIILFANDQPICELDEIGEWRGESEGAEYFALTREAAEQALKERGKNCEKND